MNKSILHLLALLSFSAPLATLAAPVDDAVVELQRDWEVIRYQTPAAEREKRFESLAAKAHKVSEIYAEYLVETKRADEAVPYLERALQAPPRSGRQIADGGRREEVRALLSKIKAH